MEIPSGFLISPSIPHRFSIVFNDNDLFEDVRPVFNSYLTEWYKILDQLTKSRPSLGSLRQAGIPTQQAAIIEGFRKSKIRTDTYTALDRKCYWEPGKYRLDINVRASKPDKAFTNSYHFSINEADSRNLKLNVVAMLEGPISSHLRIPNYPYNFAYSVYEHKQ